MNSLLEQVKKQSKTIATDSYSMSVGELLGMYREGADPSSGISTVLSME